MGWPFPAGIRLGRRLPRKTTLSLRRGDGDAAIFATGMIVGAGFLTILPWLPLPQARAPMSNCCDHRFDFLYGLRVYHERKIVKKGENDGRQD